MKLLGLAGRGGSTEDVPVLDPDEKARREAELRYWRARADSVERLARLQIREKG